jgi:hypothetical protein
MGLDTTFTLEDEIYDLYRKLHRRSKEKAESAISNDL